MKTESVVPLLEQAYKLEGTESDWLLSLMKPTHDLLDRGYGVLGYTSVIDDRGLYPQVYQRYNASRVAPLVSRFIVRLFSKNLRQATLEGRTYGMVSDFFGGDKLLGALRRGGMMWGPEDAIGIGGFDQADRVVTISAPYPKYETLSRPDLALCRFISEHLGAAMRMRRLARTAALDDDAVEVLLEESGRVAHAKGLGREEHWQAIVKEATQRMDRQRGEWSRGELSPWDAVVEGRWSLVRRIDADGRRFTVAYRNPPGVLDPRRLSHRQAEVCVAAALGNSDKEIAYDLGVSVSTVRNTLHGALGKLGLESRVQLPGLWRDLRGRAYPLDQDSAQEFLVVDGASHQDGLPHDWDLSAAESEVVWGILQGKSNAEIAQLRNVSQRTIANQIRSVFTKTGFVSRGELSAGYEEWLSGQANAARDSSIREDAG